MCTLLIFVSNASFRPFPVYLRCRICHGHNSFPLSGVSHLLHLAAVFVKKFGQLIAVHPDFVVPFFLGLVKDKLQSPVQMYGFDIVYILRRAVAGMPHVADHIPRRHHRSFRKPLRRRIVLPQMGIVIVAFFVKAADADTPAAVLVPAEGFHIAGFHGDDRRTDRNKKSNFYILYHTCRHNTNKFI